MKGLVYVVCALEYFILGAAFYQGFFGDVSNSELASFICLNQMLVALVIYRQESR